MMLHAFKLPAILFLLLSVSTAQFPIPSRYDGFPFSGQKSTYPVVLEAFVDLLCQSCKDGWPEVKKVASYYGDSKLQIIVHPFPAPFHHNAYFAARGMHAVALVNNSLPYSWMELVFEHQEEFSNAESSALTANEVVDKFAQLSTNLGIDKTQFLIEYGKPSTDLATRISFKYGCSRGVVATPTYHVNGVAVQGADDSWSVSDWRALLDPLVYDSRSTL